MKKLILLGSWCLFMTCQLMAQLNVTYISDISYSENLNDIWGYVAPDGTEYALVGAANGTSIVSLADPANPVEVAYVPGANSIWRDIKTWDTFAYVTTDQGTEGLTVIDMTNLPTSVSYTNITNVPGSGTLTTCHNIYIDEFGYAYLAGCNLNQGGMIIYDCFTDPANPTHVVNAPSTYSHDVYVRDNLMYSSEIYAGVFGIYDVSDKQNIQILGNQQTAFSFTHNTWLSDDGNFLFTTDEQGNAPIGSYDVSDPTDIIEMDQFVPLITQGDGVIPHNVHVWNDWIIVSYYTDGCIIIDGANPGNLIEVGNFDTYIPPSTGFQGVWGAYPFLPSGLIIVSDIGNGMYVLEPNYVRACWLEGTVTDSLSELPINGANVEIQSAQLNGDVSDATGGYATGIATAGTYDVIYSAAGYQTKTYEAILDNDVLTIINAELISLVPAYAVNGQVVDASNGNPIPNAPVSVRNADFEYNGTTDAGGNFTFPFIFEGDYEFFAGAWGFHTTFNDQEITGPSTLTIELDPGYRDEFALDLGWEITGDATTGTWEIGEPVGTTTGGGNPVNPDFDIAGDLGDQAYITGNGGGGSGNDDVDGGTTTLTSPSMNLSSFNSPVVSFYAWFFNGGGQGDPNDELVIRINNGSTEVTLNTIANTTNNWEGPFSYVLSDYITITNDMRIIFETSDLPGSGHLVEAAIDVFEVTEALDYPVFSASTMSGCAPLTVEYTDNGNNATSWDWSFDGGSPSASTQQNPSVTYNTPGTYSVTLTVMTPQGEAVVTQNDLIVVEGPPSTDFNVDVTDGTAVFTNLSNNADTYNWNFGDGNTSTDANPMHTYTAGGFYTVTLVATNACGSTETVQTVTINITAVADIDKALQLTASPNPFSNAVSISYDLQQNVEQAQLVVYDILGKQVFQQSLNAASGVIIIDELLSKGIYLARIEMDGVASQSLKLIKAE